MLWKKLSLRTALHQDGDRQSDWTGGSALGSFIERLDSSLTPPVWLLLIYWGSGLKPDRVIGAGRQSYFWPESSKGNNYGDSWTVRTGLRTVRPISKTWNDSSEPVSLRNKYDLSLSSLKTSVLFRTGQVISCTEYFNCTDKFLRVEENQRWFP